MDPYVTSTPNSIKLPILDTGHPKLGLWYPKESPFDLVAYSDNDYGGASQDRKSTTKGCQFLGRRLISWQCKKQTIVATSTTQAEYVAAANDNVADLLTKAFDVGRFQYLVCLSPKSTSFNEFSSNIATTLICLATNRTYNFSKMIFDGMMRNVNSKGKFLMYPRFIEKLLKMSQFGTVQHSTIYPVPFQTQKVFTTLRVNSPSFSGRTVPLFDTMIVPQDETALPQEGYISWWYEGSLKQKLKELMEFCTTLQSQQTQMAERIQKKDPTAKSLTTISPRDTIPYTRRPRSFKEFHQIFISYSYCIPLPRKEDKRKGKEIMTEPEKPAKAKIAMIHAEEDLRQMINELDRSNEMINKHMVEYEEAKNELTIEEKTELITELINYQKDFARIKKYQAQQHMLALKSERRKFYTSVLRSHAGWKTKDFRGMTFDQLEEKFILVWESIQDFVPMDSKKESESLKRSGILLEKVRQKGCQGIIRYFESMLKDFDKDDLVTLWKLVKDTFKTELPKSDLERCLFWPLKVMFELVATDLLWQFEAPIKSWKMYKSCKVHCLSMEGMIIYMLNDVEYPFQKTTLKKMLDPQGGGVK
ncbi:hypothetical protein Tco_0476297 [Tanacetum coccineum]